MPFRTILENLIKRIPHAIGAILIDWEGEAVQEYCLCSPYDIRFMAAHQGILLSRLKELVNNGRSKDKIRDFSITTEKAHLIIGSIDDDYSLMVSVDRDCPLPLALRHFRESVIELKKEI